MTSVGVGYLWCAISVLGFGSSYIPVKKIEGGVKDGFFFSFCLSCGIMLVGFVQWAICGFYKFEPFAMLGGVCWSLGNMCCPFIIQSLGLGTGQLVWSVTNMLTGWAVGTFGLLGVTQDHVRHLLMNVFGVVLVIVSLGPFMLMKNPPKGETSNNLITTEPAQADERAVNLSPSSSLGEVSVSPASLRMIGFGVALGAGVFMGASFNAASYLKTLGPPEHSTEMREYVFSHYTGILLATSLYFIVYLAVNHARHVKSFYRKDMIMPGVASGIVWGIAQVGWFEAIGVLSYVVSFPIIVSVPGVMAAVWGIVLFGENKGRRNLSLLALIIALQIGGVTMVAVSK